MNGKMRVSIVATSLDGHKPESKTVLNMVNRIQNRNPGYSEDLFSKNTPIENNTFNSISGATALKLDEQFEINNQENINLPEVDTNLENENIGISIESASYFDRNTEEKTMKTEEISQEHIETSEEYTPKLFEDSTTDNNQSVNTNKEDTHEDKLFDQDNDYQEEDLEIPAFLRRQKF